MRFLLSFLILALSVPLVAQVSEPTILRALPIDIDPVTPESTAAPILVTPSPESTPPVTAAKSSLISQKPTGDDATRLQIFLDQSNFVPGVIDGKVGLFSELAVK